MLPDTAIAASVRSVNTETPSRLSPPRALSPLNQAIKGAFTTIPHWVWVAGLYTALAIITIGRHVILHMGTVSASVGTGDPAQYMWAMRWWPYAIEHGLNPFVSHYIWWPVGVNTAQAALIPTAAIFMIPVTALFGPIAAYNVLAILSCALSALTAYLLCRRLIKREMSAIVAGYLFGFSAYEFGQLTGHMNLTLIFLLPVMVHLAHCRFDRDMSRQAYIVAMALVVLLQAGLSTELLAESVGFGALALICLRFLLAGEERTRVDRLLLDTIGAGLLALVVGSPFFYYALISGGFPKGVGPYWDFYAQDLLNAFFPTEATWLGHNTFAPLSATYSGGGVTGADGYLSIPLVIAFVVWAFGPERRRPRTRVVLTVATVAFVAALGAHMHVAGFQTVVLPFDLLKNAPIFNDLLPSRIAVFTSLAVAIGIAMWLAQPAGRIFGRWLAVALAAVMLFPNVTKPLYGVPPHNPAFFTTGQYTHYLSPKAKVLVLPFGYNDVSTLWQAEAKFSFYLVEGYVSQVVPPAFVTEPIIPKLLQNIAPSRDELWTFIRQHHVSNIIVDPADEAPWMGAMARLGLHGHSIGGVILYDISSAPSNA